MLNWNSHHLSDYFRIINNHVKPMVIVIPNCRHIHIITLLARLNTQDGDEETQGIPNE